MVFPIQISEFIIILVLFVSFSSAIGAENLTNKGVHAIGDGNICVYGKGSNILQLFGAPGHEP